MKLTEMELFDEVFTHVEDTTGKQTAYNATKLYAHVIANEGLVEKWAVPVEEFHAKYCITNRGVERDRLEALLANVEYLKKPIMFIKLPDDSHLLVDGTHRYVCYWMLKVPSIPAYMIPWDVAKAFIIEDAPTVDEEQLMSWSGLSVLRQLTEDKETP